MTNLPELALTVNWFSNAGRRGYNLIRPQPQCPASFKQICLLG